MSLNVKRVAKQVFRDVSWQHPAVRAGLPALDAADWLVRLRSTQLRQLPRYSLRIRSRGVYGQFGGRATAASSELFRQFTQARLDLRRDSQVLDIGCGCGLTALAFADFLEPGHYTGLDVDRPSIDACRSNRRLRQAGFTFLYADVEDEIYTGGSTTASEYRFPLADQAFTHVVLCSVVTHLLPDEVENYLSEIARVLRPGGRVVFSTFLTDHGRGRGLYAFPHDHGSHRLLQDDRPRKGVAYSLDFLDGAISRAGLVRSEPPVVGSWRHDPNVVVGDPLASVQDLVLARRP